MIAFLRKVLPQKVAEDAKTTSSGYHSEKLDRRISVITVFSFCDSCAFLRLKLHHPVLAHSDLASVSRLSSESMLLPS